MPCLWQTCSSKKISNLERHYDSFHGYLKKLTGQVQQTKIDFLKRENSLAAGLRYIRTSISA